MALLVAANVPAEEVEIVARHCINANLAGHDSHGIIQIPTYLDWMKAGHIVGMCSLDGDSGVSDHDVIDGNWGFGYVVNERAMKMTIEKARATNIAAATIFRQSHIGRLASYPLMAAEAGMIGMIWADSGRSSKGVAPFVRSGRELDTERVTFEHAAPGSVLEVDRVSSRNSAPSLVTKWRTRHDSNVWPSPSEGDALSS